MGNLINHDYSVYNLGESYGELKNDAKKEKQIGILKEKNHRNCKKFIISYLIRFSPHDRKYRNPFSIYKNHNN